MSPDALSEEERREREVLGGWLTPAVLAENRPVPARVLKLALDFADALADRLSSAAPDPELVAERDWYADPKIDHRRDGPALGWTTCPHDRDQSSSGGLCDTCGMPHGPTAIEAAEAERDRLREALEGAPHGRLCPSASPGPHDRKPYRCTCWKSAALADSTATGTGER